MDDFRDTPCGRGPLGDLNQGEILAYLETPGDRDVFAFRMIAGLTYILHAESDGFVDFLAETALRVQGPDGRILGAGQNPSPLSVTPVLTGLHYVTVGAADGVAEAPGAGQVWARGQGGRTVIRADFDGAPGVDLAIRIADGAAVAAGDYAAADFIL